MLLAQCSGRATLFLQLIFWSKQDAHAPGPSEMTIHFFLQENPINGAFPLIHPKANSEVPAFIYFFSQFSPIMRFDPTPIVQPSS